MMKASLASHHNTDPRGGTLLETAWGTTFGAFLGLVNSAQFPQVSQPGQLQGIQYDGRAAYLEIALPNWLTRLSNP